MIKQLTIPKNIDLEQVLRDQLPLYTGNKSGITAQGLAYIFHAIIWQWLTYKDDYRAEKYGKAVWASLSSKYLKNIVPQYQNCLNFLLQNGYIETDGIAIPGRKCRRFTIIPKYIRDGFKQFNLTGNGAVVRNLLKYHEEKERKGHEIVGPMRLSRKHLINTLKSPFLIIQEKEAKAAIEYRYNRDVMPAYWAGDEDGLRQAEINKGVSYELLWRINNMTDDFIRIDTTGYRLHTPITRLPKYLRPYITYEGEKFIALDVKNSQPYFSIALLNSEYYVKENKKYEIEGEVRGINEKNKGKGEVINNNSTPIMLQKIVQILTNMDVSVFKNYIHDVLSGQLYDRFVEVSKKDQKFHESRERIKKQFLQVMYDVPRLGGCGQRFKKAYPAVFNIFDTIKSVETGVFKRDTVS